MNRTKLTKVMQDTRGEFSKLLNIKIVQTNQKIAKSVKKTTEIEEIQEFASLPPRKRAPNKPRITDI
jgi:hypothetical protein